jgi:hypothetical protein
MTLLEAVAMDALFLLLVAALFGLSVLLIAGCEALMGER